MSRIRQSKASSEENDKSAHILTNSNPYRLKSFVGDILLIYGHHPIRRAVCRAQEDDAHMLTGSHLEPQMARSCAELWITVNPNLSYRPQSSFA